MMPTPEMVSAGEYHLEHPVYLGTRSGRRRCGASLALCPCRAARRCPARATAVCADLGRRRAAPDDEILC